MISLGLARRLKLKLNSQKRIKVSGLGGVPTYITASTQIKVTLGRRVVYILDVGVTNIGEGVDALLGMDFMYSAGVRLCIHEGTVTLPDEESVLMYGYMVRKHRERNIPITSLQDVHLRPGEHVNVKIRYGECQPLRDVVWSSRGDQWVTQVLYARVCLAKGENTETVSGGRSEVTTTVCSSTPLERLEEDYTPYMRVNAEELEQEPAVSIHEGSDMMSQLKDQLTMLPGLQDLSPRCDISKANVGEPGVTTDVQERQLKEILKRHRSIFLGDGNAAPAPARGVVCDLDVGDANPVAQRLRPVAPQVAIKVYELLKKLLETKLIEHSESPWASPIVIVLKKNGVDIRMCIDYPVVISFIRLSNYPVPLIDDLLTGFEGAMWFMSLHMASGFWAVRMTERAKLISAFVCPFGYFQWVRMPFGLKNAPLVYQHMINNCLWGFVRLPPE
ncbi:reverse transcriptase [Phytophthora palmivora]|uniref:Reverse transcriptase n=1 Tax=Phytophthora palmivora TaxID=4796 RepID=A0A2P4X6M4_9STRA|nr:reverse transcriptase [Phytophthora palmivora]